jgi:soluble lytic murein transglycosylase-like protein
LRTRFVHHSCKEAVRYVVLDTDRPRLTETSSGIQRQGKVPEARDRRRHRIPRFAEMQSYVPRVLRFYDRYRARLARRP